jgi:hypothetical protein
MSKWIRVENNVAQEIITYDPNGVINEAFLPRFKGPFADNFKVNLGDLYTQDSNSFVPFPAVPEGPPPVKEEESAPIYITQEDFRSQLTLSEKLIWDNPSNATTAQSNAITTISSDFPQRVDGDQFREELDLLESVEVIGNGRSTTLLKYFSSM